MFHFFLLLFLLPFVVNKDVHLLIYLPTQVQLTLTKIIKIVATRWRILRLKRTKFDFGWGSAPDPAGGAYSAPPDPLAGFGGPTTKERERGGRGGKGKGREGRGGDEGKGHEPPTICRKFTPMMKHRSVSLRQLSFSLSTSQTEDCSRITCFRTTNWFWIRMSTNDEQQFR